MTKELYRFAGATIALALALYVIGRVIHTERTELIALGVVIGVVFVGMVMHRYRRSHW